MAADVPAANQIKITVSLEQLGAFTPRKHTHAGTHLQTCIIPQGKRRDRGAADPILAVVALHEPSSAGSAIQAFAALTHARTDPHLHSQLQTRTTAVSAAGSVWLTRSVPGTGVLRVLIPHRAR